MASSRIGTIEPDLPAQANRTESSQAATLPGFPHWLSFGTAQRRGPVPQPL